MWEQQQQRQQQQFDASRRGESWILLAIKMQGTNRSWEGGESLPCDPGSELRLGGREQKGEDNQWDHHEKKEKKKMLYIADIIIVKRWKICSNCVHYTYGPEILRLVCSSFVVMHTYVYTLYVYEYSILYALYSISTSRSRLQQYDQYQVPGHRSYKGNNPTYAFLAPTRRGCS